jgi:hypothetical protein
MRLLLILGAAALATVGAALFLTRAPAAAQGTLPTLEGPSLESRVDPSLSAVLTRLGGRAGEVRCWSSADWRRRSAEVAAHGGGQGRELAGYLALDRGSVNLPARTCNVLDSLAATDESAYAAKVFAHELQHFRGVRDEATAECFGLQWTGTVAVGLGLDGASARELSWTAWSRLYVHENPRYRSPDCYEGGPLDLNPDSRAWP